jgi:CheY-like chemotaxis protein
MRADRRSRYLQTLPNCNVLSATAIAAGREKIQGRTCECKPSFPFADGPRTPNWQKNLSGRRSRWLSFFADRISSPVRRAYYCVCKYFCAIDSVTRARPDLVITDIGLSDGDGFQLLSVIKKLDLESGTDTPVLAMSAHADLILGRRAADAGFSNFLRKPFTPDRLIEAISEALGLDQEAP